MAKRLSPLTVAILGLVACAPDDGQPAPDGFTPEVLRLLDFNAPCPHCSLCYRNARSLSVHVAATHPEAGT